jgi:hypothetical protein
VRMSWTEPSHSADSRTESAVALDPRRRRAPVRSAIGRRSRARPRGLEFETPGRPPRLALPAGNRHNRGV